MYHSVTPNRLIGRHGRSILSDSNNRCAGFTNAVSGERRSGNCWDRDTVEARSRLVGLTFDDGYADFAEYSLPVLQRHGFTATAFMVAGRLGNENIWAETASQATATAGQVRLVAEAGCRDGLAWLASRIACVATDAELTEEIVNSRRILQQISGQQVSGFCYPHGHHDRPHRQLRPGRWIRVYMCMRVFAVHRVLALPRIYMGNGDTPARLWAKAIQYWLRWEYRGPGPRSRSGQRAQGRTGAMTLTAWPTVRAGVTGASRWTRRVSHGILGDPLYRSSVNLFLNLGIMTVLGITFYTLATHYYPVATVGVFTAITAGMGLLATSATLGLQNTITRHIASAQDPRALLAAAVAVITSAGAVLCLITLLVIGPHLPAELGIRQHGSIALLVTALVVVSAVGSVINAGLIATRASHLLLIANVAGGVVKVVAIVALTAFRSSGILIAFSLGLVIGTAVGCLALFRRVPGTGLTPHSFAVLRRHATITIGNYFATVMGNLPSALVPLVILAIGGPVETAHFGIAASVVALLTIIPSTISGVLFAEGSRPGANLGQQCRKALRGTYAVMLPALVIVIVAGPFALRVFGSTYATAADVRCLRVLALSCLPMGGAYMVDSLLIARDRIAAYVFMNGANAALVLGCVGALVSRGLTAAAAGWTLGQLLSFVLALAVLTMGQSDRHPPHTPPAAT